MRSRPRVTITLPRDLLRQIDRMIDETTIRNRSHAIETLLRRSLMPNVTSAVVLAGGQGTNGPVPALRTIAGRPLIYQMVEHLVRYGIRRVYVLAGQKAEELQAALGAGHASDATVEFLAEEAPLGTSGAVKAVEGRFEAEPVLVLHGDVLTDIDLSDFIRFHRQEGSLATIAVKPREAERRYGKVMLQGNRITEFLDIEHSEGISIVNAGVYLLEPEALGMIEGGKPTHFETDLFPRLAAIDELSAFIFQGVWFDVSDEASYRMAQERWAARREEV